MSDTISTVVTTTRTTNGGALTAPIPVGTRVRVTDIYPTSLSDAYKGHIGTVVVHRAGVSPQVRFDFAHEGTREWWVEGFEILPMPGQRAVIRECLTHALDEFKGYATGREVTYLSTDISTGSHLVRFDDVTGNGDIPNPATVTVLDFVLGAEVPVADLTSSEPVVSTEQRDADARVKFEALVEAINDLAEREEWCGNFEEWCEEAGIESRRRRDKDFSVTIDLTYEIDSDDVIAMFKRQVRGEHDDVDVESVTLTSTVVISVTTSEDNPHDMDSYEVESHLSDAGYSGWDEWSITDYEDSY